MAEGFAGTAGESSSFRHGMFEKIVLSIEIVLANGEVVTASREQNIDLFNGASSSLGTLGIVTALKVKLVDAKRYVELTYHPTGGVCGTLEKLKDLSKDDSVDYLDGILFSSDRGIILLRPADGRGQCDGPTLYQSQRSLVLSTCRKI